MIGTNSDMRILRLEGLIRQLQRQVDALRTSVGTVAQNAWEPSPLSDPGSPTSGVFKMVSAAGIAGGASATETIQQRTGGAWSPIGTATVVNPMPADAITAGHTCPLMAVGDGTYVAVSQSCT